MMKHIVSILLFVLGCFNSLLGSNRAAETLTITDLRVNPEVQGEQGITQLVLRTTVDYSGANENLSYVYSITAGEADLASYEDFAILDNITSKEVTIQVVVSDNNGATDTTFIVYKSNVVVTSSLYTDVNTWKNAVDYFKPKDPAFVFQNRVEGLPKVLIIGHSISVGYTPFVQENLRGVCNVNRVPTNAGNTIKSLQNLDFWLAGEDWDVIHFALGIHDINYFLNGQLDTNGVKPVTEEKYRANLEALIAQFKSKTNAKLIFGNCTSIHEGTPGRFASDVPIYNTIAEDVMSKHNIPVDDHYTLSVNNPSDFLKDGVHFNGTGQKRQAKQVTALIKQELNIEDGDDNNNSNNYAIWKSGSSKWNVKVSNKASNGFNRSSLGVWAFQDIAVEPGKEYEVTFNYGIANSSGSKGAGIKVGIHEGAVSVTNFSSLALKTYTTNAVTPNVEMSNGSIKFTPTQQSVKVVVFKIGEGSKKASASVSNLDIKQTTLSASLYERLGVKVEIDDNKIIVDGGAVEVIYNSLGQEIKNHDLDDGIYFVRITNGKQSDIVKLIK